MAAGVAPWQVFDPAAASSGVAPSSSVGVDGISSRYFVVDAHLRMGGHPGATRSMADKQERASWYGSVTSYVVRTGARVDKSLELLRQTKLHRSRASKTRTAS